jgi:phage terminase large subunit-like protein
MGLRGIGAKPLSARISEAESSKTVEPWQVDGLSRLERVIAFLESTPITAGRDAGKPFRLREWQRQFVEATYAVDADGVRLVRTSILSMGRKNGKTDLAARLALCHLAGPESESRGECYSAANDVSQAAKIFAEMKAILASMPSLDNRVNQTDFRKEMSVLFGRGAGSIFKALSADAGTKLGLNCSFFVYDEAGTAPSRHLFDALDTSMGGRQEPLGLLISTQAADDVHFFSQLVDHGKAVAAGTIEDPAFHLTIFEAEPELSISDPATWALANPALGDFRSLPDVERQASQAQKMPSKEAAFRNLILNQRVHATARFVNRSEWQACGDPVDAEALKGQSCFGGLDLSFARDLSALVLAFPQADGTIATICRFWLPEIGIGEKSDTDRIPWRLWATQGHLTLTPGKTISPVWIAQELVNLSREYQIESILFDRFRIAELQRALADIGHELPLAEFGQGFASMSPVVDMLERAIADKRLRHGGHPILTLCASNAIVTADPAGNRKMDKARSAGKIDGLVALGMALKAAESREPEKPLPAWVRALLD